MTAAAPTSPSWRLTITSRAHVDGTGAGAWAARILGQGTGRILRREFCPKQHLRRGAGRKLGVVLMTITRPGVYELRRVGGFAGWSEWSGFIRVDARGEWWTLGTREGLSVAEVLEAIRGHGATDTGVAALPYSEAAAASDAGGQPSVA